MVNEPSRTSNRSSCRGVNEPEGTDTGRDGELGVAICRRGDKCHLKALVHQLQALPGLSHM